MTAEPKAPAKQALRVAMRRRRRAMTASDRLAAAEGAARAVLEVVRRLQPDGPIAAYWPIGEELDPRFALVDLDRRGHPLAMPVVAAAESPLQFRRWAPDDPMDEGPHGTVHPQKAAPLCTPSLILLPLLAFDRRGHRLGQGGGYYDRTLASLRATGPVLAFGLAFSGQEVDKVPVDDLDQPLDGVITETGVWSLLPQLSGTT